LGEGEAMEYKDMIDLQDQLIKSLQKCLADRDRMLVMMQEMIDAQKKLIELRSGPMLSPLPNYLAFSEAQ